MDLDLHTPAMNLIYARSLNNVIGNDDQLPWHIPGDLERFKDLTRDGVVVMGRKTWQSLPENARPLRNRVNVVMSRLYMAHGDGIYPNTQVLTAATPGRVMEILRWYQGKRNIWIMGGVEVYKTFEKLVDRVYETVVMSNQVSGDAFYKFQGSYHVVSEEFAKPCIINGESVPVMNRIFVIKR